jgi:hypothetical protein
MPTFDVLSGTWYHITAPDLETAQKAYDAYWEEDGPLPDDCKVVEGEVDSHWIPVDLDGMDLTLEQYTTILKSSPNKTTLEAMKDALEGNTDPEPPTHDWKPAW